MIWADYGRPMFGYCSGASLEDPSEFQLGRRAMENKDSRIWFISPTYLEICAVRCILPQSLCPHIANNCAYQGRTDSQGGNYVHHSRTVMPDPAGDDHGRAGVPSVSRKHVRYTAACGRR